MYCLSTHLPSHCLNTYLSTGYSSIIHLSTLPHIVYLVTTYPKTSISVHYPSYLSLHPFSHPFIHHHHSLYRPPSIHPLSVYTNAFISIHYLIAYLSIHPSATLHLSLYPSIRPPIHPPTHHPSIFEFHPLLHILHVNLSTLFPLRCLLLWSA